MRSERRAYQVLVEPKSITCAPPPPPPSEPPFPPVDAAEEMPVVLVAGSNEHRYVAHIPEFSRQLVERSHQVVSVLVDSQDVVRDLHGERPVAAQRDLQRHPLARGVVGLDEQGAVA